MSSESVRTPLKLSRNVRAGLTLIELVVVMVILAALAALLIPRLGFLKDSADTVTAAAGASEVANNLETYKAAVGSYPLRMDSLIKDDGSGLYDRFTSNGTTAAAPSWLVMEDLTAGSSGYWYSVIRGGPQSVMDHVVYAALSDPSSSGTVLRDYNTNGKTAVVNVTATPSTTVARIMEASGYPGALPANTKLVAFGIGPRCGLVGQTMSNVPRFSMQPQEFYARFIAVFAAFDNGFSAATKPMQLRCVLDSRGFPVDYRLNQVKLAAPKQE